MTYPLLTHFNWPNPLFFRAKGLAVLALLLAVSQVGVRAQISGVVNVYSPVTLADFCNNLVVVPDAAPFDVGDRVLLIQMQGAVMDTTDTANYGDISDFRQTGKYEFLTIADIDANLIFFEEAVVNEYDGPSIQLILVPQYTDVTVGGGALTAQPWDGFTGGVLAIEVSGTLTLNDNIDASGLGFRGGAVATDPACFGGSTGYDGYRCASGCGGQKGESIARISTELLGRGRPSNGGGGGNDHLTGGGGGANFAVGGIGGTQLAISPGDCPGNFPGLGGRTLFYSNTANRAFLGGGGGAGDDQGGTASPGGNGGGLLFIRAGTLAGNGFSIRSNGDAPPFTAGADGAGGGGAAGSALMEVANYAGPVSVFLLGGDGGSVDNGNDPSVCAGPGGGGSGGAFWPSGAVFPAAVALNLGGGISGNTVNVSAPIECGRNGAAGGSTGDTLSGLVMVASDLVFEPLAMVLTPDTLVCPADSLLIGVLQATGTGQLSYLWSTGDTTALIYGGPITATTTYTVTLFDERGCSIAESITVIAGRPVGATADPAGLIAPGQSVVLEATEDPLWVSYTWAPDSSLSSNTGRVVVANPFENITYCVFALDTLGCLSQACVDIPVDLLINMPNAFTPNGDGLNDLFRVPVSVPCEELVLFQVFDRWGEQVFSSTLEGIGWDGTYRGKPQETGVYIYRVELLCGELQQRKSFTGTVTVLY